MTAILLTIRKAIAGRWILWTATTIGVALVYNLTLLLALVVRFGQVPNYVTFYDYIGNVLNIVENTPAISDMIPIIREEWLIEVGYMNYDYGNGISEWSLTVLPEKLLVMLAMGALIATVAVLLLPGRDGVCAAVPRKAAVGAAGGGAALIGLSSATISWVVCCAAPTWVVSLTMLGMGVSLAFWLEPLGTAITLSGFGLLLLAVVLLAIHSEQETSDPRAVPPISRGGMSAASS